jgi:disulfide bond formation protein DsbB
MASVLNSRLPAVAIFAVSGAVLLSAFLFEHVGGLAPCELCWYQRYAHMAVLAILLPAFYFHRRPGAVPPLLGGAGLASLVGAGVALYQVGVEQNWWESACATPIRGDTLDEIRASLMAAPVVRCDEIAWSLWHVSMAGWNALLSLALAAGAMYAAFMMERGK